MAKAPTDPQAVPSDGEAKPPFLRRVRIRNYKSIAFCDVALQPLTILVGRNASGKSNFLDALAFLRDVLTKGTDEAVQSHGGRKAILPRSGRSSIVSFELEFLVIYQDEERKQILESVYQISIKLPIQSKSVVVSERFAIKNFQGRKIMNLINRKGERWKGMGEPWKEMGESKIFKFVSNNSLLMGTYWPGSLSNFNLGLLNSGVYNFSPESIRELHEPTPGTRLKRDGRNLAGVIKDARSEDPEIVNRVQGYLSTIVEEVERFDFVRYGEYETLRFQVRSGGGGKTMWFDAASMSDGTLRVLASLVAAFHVSRDDGPGVVGIEEPENALHPAAVRALVDALEEASGRNQILLTTHSAEILADRDVHPSQILIVRNRDGQTQITPVDAASKEIIEKELYSLADLQRQDLLDLDEADLRRQEALRSGDRGA